MTDAGDVTLASYEAAARRYVEQIAPPGAALVGFLDRLVELVGTGHVLELGSGPGRDAAYLEQRGLRVTRTDATRAFVELMRADGHSALQLDARTDDLGGPYDAVLANAMLLHLTRRQFADVLQRAGRAVVDGGVFAFALRACPPGPRRGVNQVGVAPASGVAPFRGGRRSSTLARTRCAVEGFRRCRAVRTGP